MIIVDLDDTVLDTRRTLRVEKLRDCARLAPDPAAFEDYVVSRAHERIAGRTLIAEACAAFGLDEDLESLMLAEYYGNHPVDPRVPLLPGAREALSQFGELDELVCVTAGQRDQQLAKIAGAGLAGSFSRVIVVEGAKGEAYATLLGDADPSSVVVIGDKLGDVEPARELGMRAILFGPPLDAWDGERAEDWPAVLRLVDRS